MLTNDAPAFSSRSICLLFHHSAGPGRRVGTSRIIFFDTHHITYINIPLGWHACLHLLGPFGFPLRYHSLVYCCASRPHSGCQQGKGKHGSGRGGGGLRFWISVQDGKRSLQLWAFRFPMFCLARAFQDKGMGNGRRRALYNEIRRHAYLVSFAASHERGGDLLGRFVLFLGFMRPPARDGYGWDGTRSLVLWCFGGWVA